MKYFSHIMAVGFFVLAAVFHSWPLGICAVIIAALITAREVHETYVLFKKATSTEQLMQSVLEDNRKMREQVEKMQSEMGAVNFKVNQFASYVGAPNE